MQEEPIGFNPKILEELVTFKMPFGKYKDTIICDIPSFYLEWFIHRGKLPDGKLGMLLSTMYEIKTNGLDDLLKPLKAKNSKYNK
ncbi:MAG: DUF3820 family protein [Saprospirales bacterium]|jgi:uncharacterized protein (DUF3820 family)|nr:DUF3820 family protein [Saprospirales bacterium]